MKIEFIAIGSEMLYLDRIESNSLRLQGELKKMGHLLHRKTMVGDSFLDIKNLLIEAVKRSDIIIFSGGLGPTVDDITVAAVAGALGEELMLHNATWDLMLKKLLESGRTPNEGHKKQAYIINGAQALPNMIGQAPGQYIEHRGKHIILLPGVPGEFNNILENEVVPLLKKIIAPLQILSTLFFKFADISESELDIRISSKLGHLLPKKDEQLIITTKPGIQTVTLITPVENKSLDERRCILEKAFLETFPDNFYSYEDATIEEVTGRILRQKGLKVAVAESCTGGLLASRITDVPGASDYFIEGVISYHNTAKESLLGVRIDTLHQHGAVSEETAYEMAEGLLDKTGVAITCSITGIAGPDGGSPEKPLGTVFIGIADKKDITVHKRNITGTRRFFKEWVTSVTLNYLRLRALRFH